MDSNEMKILAAEFERQLKPIAEQIIALKASQDAEISRKAQQIVQANETGPETDPVKAMNERLRSEIQTTDVGFRFTDQMSGNRPTGNNLRAAFEATGGGAIEPTERGSVSVGGDPEETARLMGAKNDPITERVKASMLRIKNDGE